MAARGISRSKNIIGTATPTHAPVYVDSDDNKLKMVPAGSGTTEVEIVDASSTQTLTNKTFSGAADIVLQEIVTATNVILASESGKTFFLNAATEFVSTLPAPAVGLYFKFVVTGAPSGASYTIVAASGTPIHGFVLSKDLNGLTDGGATAGTGVLTITLVDGKAQKGDTVIIESDGTDYFAVAMTGGNFDAITFS